MRGIGRGGGAEAYHEEGFQSAQTLTPHGIEGSPEWRESRCRELGIRPPLRCGPLSPFPTVEVLVDDPVEDQISRDREDS